MVAMAALMAMSAPNPINMLVGMKGMQTEPYLIKRRSDTMISPGTSSVEEAEILPGAQLTTMSTTQGFAPITLGPVTELPPA